MRSVPRRSTARLAGSGASTAAAWPRGTTCARRSNPLQGRTCARTSSSGWRAPGRISRLEAATVARQGARWRVDVEVTQATPPYRLRLPLALQFEGGAEDLRWVSFDDERQRFALLTDRRPVGVTLDPRHGCSAASRRRGAADPAAGDAGPATVTVLAGAAANGESLARPTHRAPAAAAIGGGSPAVAAVLLVGSRTRSIVTSRATACRGARSHSPCRTPSRRPGCGPPSDAAARRSR